MRYRFTNGKTFAPSRLSEQIGTRGPGFTDRLKKILPFTEPRTYLLSPVEVQRDVVRLRQFYALNGFLKTNIEFYTSRYSAERNDFRLVFTINEGESLKLADIQFLGADGKPYAPTEGEDNISEIISLKVGDRYSEIERLRVLDQAVTWLKNQGHAFTQVLDSVEIDPVKNLAVVRLFLDPGPKTYIDEIIVEGNESVSKRVIRRELPFKVGDVFSSKSISRGQRKLFSMNLFRTAIIDVPPQETDNTVTIRVRVREGRPRLVSYQVGYGRQSGLALQGDWTHRNFWGDARLLSAGLVANTGFQARTEDRITPRLFRGSVAVRQPYFFTTKLSGSLALFTQFERDPELPKSDNTLGINEREIGLDAALYFEVLPYRSITVQYQWSRALQFTQPTETISQSKDRFSRGSITLSALLGKTTDYLRGGTGFLVRPFYELAAPSLGSDVHYTKIGVDASGFYPVVKNMGIWGRLFVGRLWPHGGSRDQTNPRTENRFDQIRFYAGGSNDLRGWATNLAGRKEVRLDIVDADTLFVYEAIGGLAKIGAEVEFRFPFPGLSEAWGTAVFVGTSNVSEGAWDLDQFRTSAGGGIRYVTPVGLLRLDLAYKLNPDELDLRRADQFFLLGREAKTKWTRYWAIHLSIGQAF